MKIRTLVLFVLVTALTTLTACGAWWLPRPHKIDIQQGNLLSTEKVKLVKIGMSKTEVTRILGRPITSNQIDDNRWDYIFSFNRSGEDPRVKRLSLDFQDDVVANLETDGLDLE